jgi:hypothetical protein
MADSEDSLKLTPLDAVLVQRRQQGCIKPNPSGHQLRVGATLLCMQPLKRADNVVSSLNTAYI